jgi:hypothetical protein
MKSCAEKCYGETVGVVSSAVQGRTYTFIISDFGATREKTCKTI